MEKKTKVLSRETKKKKSEINGEFGQTILLGEKSKYYNNVNPYQIHLC